MLFVVNLKGGKEIMEKKVYVPATIEIVKFTSEDVLTLSGPTVNDKGYGKGSTIWGGKHHGFFFDEDDE